jgi:Eukaryotic cytochrome b561
MQGIIALNGRSTYTDGYKYNQKVTTHWVLQASALLMITIAQISIYVNKNINGYPHYQTVHSICGLVTFIFTIGASLFGTCTLYSNALKNFIKPVQLKVGHAFGGSIVFVASAATICTGINQTWTDEKDVQVKLGAMAVLFIGSFYVVSRSIKTALARIATMSKK